MQKRISILDGNNVYSRAWFAAGKREFNSDTAKKAVDTFKGMVVKIRREQIPEEIIICWDDGKDKERLALLKDYKKRDEKPKSFYNALNALKEEIKTLQKHHYQVQEKDVEADDLIGTLAMYYSLIGYMVTIVSDDKDMFQLLDENVVISHSKKGMIDEYKFKELFGFKHAAFIDYLALLGDDIDNIPGVTGIGKVTAAKLITNFHSLEGVYENIETLKGAQKAALKKEKANVFLYRKLIKLKTINLDMTKLPE